MSREMRMPKIWEVRDADDNVVRTSAHPVFELSSLEYGQYVRCVRDVPSPEGSPRPEAESR